MRYSGCVQFFSAMVILLCLILVLLRIGRSLLHDNNIDNEYCTNDICYSDTMIISNQLSLAQLVKVTSNTNSLRDLQQEFMRVPVNIPSWNELPPGVEDKNRYSDIIPNARTRVPLLAKSGGTDYINANFITGYNNRGKAYIATQGPLYNTVNDYWRMIWQQKVSVIIMVTGLVEGYREKCYQYWPNSNDDSILYDDIRVSISDRISNEHYTNTKLIIENTQLDHAPHTVTHLWYTDWPDHGIPDDTAPLIEFIQQYRMIKSMTTPTVVHCSAGIGRTGVFIAIDIGISTIDDTNSVDILKILSTLRQYRGGLIQTPKQYIFVYQALADYSRHYKSDNTS